MSLELGIPDGEYELELSEVLQDQLEAAHKSSKARPVHRVNDEILSIRYGFRPDSIDDTQPTELVRDETPSRSSSSGTFQLRSQSTEHEQRIVFEGTSLQPKDLECILIFNPYSKSFELQKLDSQLRTNSIVKNRTQSVNKKNAQEPPQPNEPTSTASSAVTSPATPPAPSALKKRPQKEPSIFQPKPRARTPLSRPPVGANSSGNHSISKTSDRTTSTRSSDEDEVPLSKLGSIPSKQSNLSTSTSSPSLSNTQKNATGSNSSSIQTSPEKQPINSSKPGTKRASPTNSVSPEKKSKITPSNTKNLKKSSQKKSPEQQPKPQSTSSVSSPNINIDKVSNSRNTTPQPRSNSNTSNYSTTKNNNNNTLRPLPNQVSSKKPPSTISTPTIQQESPSDDDDFGSLVDELEEELLSGDDNFITVEDGSKDTSFSNNRAYDFGVKNGNGPINFRHLAGMNSKDEDELSSSEEE